MIQGLLWQCPPGLIARALKEYPVTGEKTVLNEPTGDFFYDTWKIKDIYKDTVWQQVLDTLPMTIGQARIIKLEPGDSYQAHADIDNRWHLNLTGEQAYLIDLDNQKMFECKCNNHWYYMDASHIHAATNYGSIPRLQLVVREPLRRSRQPINLVSIDIGPAYEQSRFRYKFDNLISPWLNRANQQYKISDFKHNFDSVSFKLEQELVAELEALITEEYQLTIHTT
jgi:hypothetical protein